MTAAPVSTEVSGSVNASTTQPIAPTIGTSRGGRPSDSRSVQAEALAMQ
ncbi:Uncharacterised protein [Tsukamurella paurometabola]|uniref:Uncharacterized protein n=1 Tax=Tsukamurella paurometabola TaxID=2061 RepID=A0A3P8KFT3_TSUPA|nr:Uncharacterised protein [Tsukamurella paurometabola]